MSLGKTISRLRAEKNLSQGDLADLLEVSRQSVSKWETDASVPDLDKLVKLSEVFGVTLDELVKGAAPESEQTTQPAQEQVREVIVRREGLPSRKIAGTVLLCMGFLVVVLFTALGALLGGLIFASPFLFCGAICFIFQRRVGLWCAWAVYFLVDVYLRYATGINFRLTLWTPHFTPQMNYMRLATAWGQLLVMALLFVITLCSFRKTRIELTKRNSAILICGWVAFIALYVLVSAFTNSLHNAYLYPPLDWLCIGLFTALLTATVCALRKKKPA